MPFCNIQKDSGNFFFEHLQLIHLVRLSASDLPFVNTEKMSKSKEKKKINKNLGACLRRMTWNWDPGNVLHFCKGKERLRWKDHAGVRGAFQANSKCPKRALNK